MKGSQLVGDTGIRERVEHDYYATPIESTKILLDNIGEYITMNGKHNIFLEPCVGGDILWILLKIN